MLRVSEQSAVNRQRSCAGMDKIAREWPEFVDGLDSCVTCESDVAEKMHRFLVCKMEA